MAHWLKFLENSKRGLWYDGRCGRFKISNLPVTFESNQNRPIRIRIKSRIFAGP